MNYSIFMTIITLALIQPNAILADENIKFSNKEVKENKTSLTNNEIINEIKTLVQYEIDHSFLMEQAIHNLENQVIKDELVSYRNEIEDNIKKLSVTIEKLGGKAPNHSRDFKGFFLQGYAAMRGLTSDHGVLQALHTNEKLISKAYEKALKLAFPEDLKALVEESYQPNKEVFDYVKKQVDNLK